MSESDPTQTGYIQIYTGNGKGKTTAAIGVTVRALAHGFKVFFCQFMKNTPSGEQKFFDAYKEQITFTRSGTGKFIFGKPSKEDIDLALEAFEYAKKETLSATYDLVVLDELNVAVYFGLIPLENALDLLKNKPLNTELIITGRNAPEEFTALADLVTSMEEVKHYYKIGVQARRGIEE